MDSFNAVQKTQGGGYLEQLKRLDRGHVTLMRRDESKRRMRAIDAYVSGGIGTHIRDGETGHSYPELVGSFDEDLYFKVVLANGELTGVCPNGFNVLFYPSPEAARAHLRMKSADQWDANLVEKWRNKQRDRLRAIGCAVSESDALGEEIPQPQSLT